MGTDHTSIRRVSRIVLAALLSLAAVASAKAFEVTAEQRAACTPDALRLCASEIPDIGRITACMMAKQASLSPQCRAVFQTASREDSRSHQRLRIASSHASYRVTRSYDLHGRHLHEAVRLASRYRESRGFGSGYVEHEPFSSRNGRWMHSREGRQALSMARKIVGGFCDGLPKPQHTGRPLQPLGKLRSVLCAVGLPSGEQFIGRFLRPIFLRRS
ncbi:MAG: hypothetical protein WA649_00310 [Methylovirgula sp.]